MRHVRLRASIVLAMIAIAGTPLVADVVDLVSSKDNTLYTDATGAFSNGSGAFMFSGLNAAEAERRAVVAFDLATAIPSGSTVTSVSLTLHCSRSVALSGLFSLHRVMSDWGEGTSNAGDPGGQGTASQAGDCTWIHRAFPDVLWSTPGGDFVATPSVTTNVGGIGFATWTDAGLVGDVQAWIDTPSSNFGWLIRNLNGDFRNTRRFDTRENTDPNVRPMLHVVFTPPPRCIADTDDGSGTGTPDGGVTIDDLLYFLFVFEAGDSRADVDDGTFTGVPDGGVTIDDLLYFLQRFANGC